MNDQEIKQTPPRLKDVARRAGVSETATSMVFSGRGRISEETKQTVHDAARELGYIHPQRKKRINNDKTNVGILLITDRESSFLWHYMTEMINQIERDLVNLELNTVLIPISIEENDDIIYQKINQAGCRAVFSIHAGKEKLFDKLENEEIPVIVILNSNYKDRHFSICVDNLQLGFDGTRELIKLGHTRINFIDDYREGLPKLSADRYYGYRKALEENGISYKEEYRFNCVTTPGEKEMEEKLNTMLSGDDPPTAFFCLDDEIAFRLWFALTRMGYSIPDDFSVIAPGDVIDYSKPYVPPITTMHINMTDMGKLAVNMLKNRIINVLDTHQVLNVRGTLFSRGSCKRLTKESL